MLNGNDISACSHTKCPIYGPLVARLMSGYNDGNSVVESYEFMNLKTYSRLDGFDCCDDHIKLPIF